MDRLFLIIAIVAAVLGCVADQFLLYSPKGNFHTGDFLFFQDISISRITWGYFLGILVIPFELLGFHVLVNRIFTRDCWEKTLFFFGICYLFVLGVCYHGIVSYLGFIEKSKTIESTYVAASRQLHDPLVAVLTVVFIVLAVAAFYFLKREQHKLPSWLLFFNPIFVYAGVIVLYFALPVIGNHLMVAGLNFSILVFLSAFLMALGKEPQIAD